MTQQTAYRGRNNNYENVFDFYNIYLVVELNKQMYGFNETKSGHFLMHNLDICL